jgi:hypothetical protein
MSTRLQPSEPGSDLVTVDRHAAAPAAIATIEKLQAAVQRGEITAKFAREALVRLIPPAKPPMARIELPVITDAASYAEACRAVMAATADGRIAPADATQLLRACKMSFEAARVFQRTQR